MSLWDEIFSQPKVLSEILSNHRSEAEDVARWINRQDFAYIVIAARGTSDNAARYSQYLWGSQNRLSVALTTPSLFGLYQSPPSLEQALVVGISQSGESPDLIAVLDEARRQHRPTLAITNNANSPMAAAADLTLDIRAGTEAAVAATKSYTCQLLAIALISAGLARSADLGDAIDQVVPAISTILADPSPLEEAAKAIAPAQRCAVIGRGLHLATAHEWALKITELAYLVAQPFSAADFRHGPIALIEPGLPVLAVATSGPLFDDVAALITQTRRSGARVIAISDRPDCPADHLLALPAGTPEWLSPLPAIVAAQLFTYYLTRARGYDPDQPRGLQKVTLTR